MRTAIVIVSTIALLATSLLLIRQSADRMAKSPYTDPADRPVFYRVHDQHDVDEDFTRGDDGIERWTSAGVSTPTLISWLWHRPRHEIDLDAIAGDDRRWVIDMDASGPDPEAVRALTRERVAEVVGFTTRVERRAITAHELRVHPDGLRLAETTSAPESAPGGQWGALWYGAPTMRSEGSDIAALAGLFGVAMWSDVFPPLAWVIDATGLDGRYVYRFEFEDPNTIEGINRELAEEAGLVLVPVEREVDVLVFEPTP